MTMTRNPLALALALTMMVALTPADAAVKKKKRKRVAPPAATQPAPAAAPEAAQTPPAVAPAPAPAPAVAPVAAPAPAPALKPARSTVGSIYAGGALGLTRWNIDSDAGLGITADQSSNGLKAFVGHQYNDWLAAEVGFVNLGKGSQTSAGLGTFSFKSSGLFIDGVGRHDLTPQIGLLGRVGAVYMDTKANDASKKSAGLKLGAGADYRLLPNLRLRAEVESYPVKSPATGALAESSSRVLLLGVGAAYSF